ncbi:LPXTG cell wall anchor domain-containing protein [Candidatus Woesearchaeota archaeon]|nr:LPXTG cell wall anchor domain-containing protein [Candidatus Woesearchaeota archaeon]
MVVWGGSTRWLCHDCNYSAMLFPEVPKSSLSTARKEITGKTIGQEKTINKLLVSKGFLNKKVNFIPAIFYVMDILAVLAFILWTGYAKVNYGLMIIGFLALVMILTLLFYLKKKIVAF